MKDAAVSHPSGKSASYGELVKFAAATPPGTVVLKERKLWQVIGQRVPRLDVPAKVDGSARFGLDIRLPAMLYAAVRLCSMLGGAPGAIRPNDVLARPGVERLVRLPAYAGSTAGFAVVAKTSWHAQQAVQAVDVDWHAPPQRVLSSGQIDKALEAAVKEGGGFGFYDRGSVDDAEGKAVRQIDSWYRAPYLAHATMEPMNCTAQFKDSLLEIWVPTQVPEMARAIAAQVADLPLKSVTLHVTLLGGGFGRRLEVDYVAQAVRVAMECGGGVRSNWLGRAKKT